MHPQAMNSTVGRSSRNKTCDDGAGMVLCAATIHGDQLLADSVSTKVCRVDLAPGQHGMRKVSCIATLVRSLELLGQFTLR
mmetsp:Transcript_44172/g.79469  ORF Transcript_44172/g.79469 Transcript_44172/m.79469 type:complete len:81 (-) Transcript_44172:4-246(-)